MIEIRRFGVEFVDGYMGVDIKFENFVLRVSV